MGNISPHYEGGQSERQVLVWLGCAEALPGAQIADFLLLPHSTDTGRSLGALL